MRVLLDENMPRTLSRHFEAGVEVKTVGQCGWEGVSNGALLRLAQDTFDAFITMDQGIPHQQNLSDLSLGILLLEATSNRLVDLMPLMDAVNQALRSLSTGVVVRVAA